MEIMTSFLQAFGLWFLKSVETSPCSSPNKVGRKNVHKKRMFKCRNAAEKATMEYICWEINCLMKDLRSGQRMTIYKTERVLIPDSSLSLQRLNGRFPTNVQAIQFSKKYCIDIAR